MLVLFAITPLIFAAFLSIINRIFGFNTYILKQLKENGIEINVKSFGFNFEYIKMISEYNRLLKRKKNVSKKDRFICRWVTFENIFVFVSALYFLVFVFIVFQNS